MYLMTGHGEIAIVNIHLRFLFYADGKNSVINRETKTKSIV